MMADRSINVLFVRGTPYVPQSEIARAIADERAAVVAYLERYDGSTLAGAIERGEHLKEADNGS